MEPLTVDDSLKMEALGSAAFSPDAALILFGRERSLLDSTRRGYDDGSMIGQRAFVARATDGTVSEIKSDLEADLTPVDGTTDRWAPDSSGALLMRIADGGYRLAYWDARKDTVTVLPGRPPGSSGYYLTFGWLAGGLVYPSLADGVKQPFTFYPILEALNERWLSAWNGSKTHVTVSSDNPVFESTVPPPSMLLFADPRTGRSTKIAEGDYFSITVSPDRHRFAAVCKGERIAEPMFGPAARGELQIFEMSGAVPRLAHRFTDLDIQALGNYERDWQPIQWSADSRHLLVGGKGAGEPRRMARIYAIDARTGHRKAFSAERLSFLEKSVYSRNSFLPMGWLGSKVIAMAAREVTASASAISTRTGRGTRQTDYGEMKDTRLDVYALAGDEAVNLTAFARTSVDRFLVRHGGGSLLVIADGALWSLVPGKKPRRVSPGGLGVVLDFARGRSGYLPPIESAYFRSNASELVALFVVTSGETVEKRVVLDLSTGTVITSGPGTFLASSPDQRRVVARLDSKGEQRLVLHDGGEHTLAAVNTWLRERVVAPAVRFDYRYQGRDLVGWVVTPPHAATAAPLPAVVSVYGGEVYGEQPPTVLAEPFKIPLFSAQLLATQGYAVVYPSLPIGPAETTDVMAALAEETVAALDVLAAKGVIDPQRVGLMGQSFGGFSVAAILTQRSDRFRAAVSTAGAYDWMFTYGMTSLIDSLGQEGPIEWSSETGQIRLERPFWKDAAAFERNSPIFHVQSMNTPLLMLHGDLDIVNTNLYGAERMYRALVQAGKKPVLIRYWGEGHVAYSEAAVRDQWSRVTAWFGHYLEN